MSEALNVVLLVDDEPKLLAALRRRLSTWFTVRTAESGAEALAMIDADPSIAVMIADMQMPGMNGIELLKRVRDKAPHIRRMMLTGNSDQETAIAAVNEGQVMRFMRKPCEAETLKEAIDRAFEDIQFEAGEVVSPSSDDAPNVDAARDAFLSMMNHELRTPLNHIIGLSALLQAEGPLGADAKSQDYLRQISASGEELLHIVNRTLEFSKLRSDAAADRRPGVFDLVSLVNREVDRLRAMAAKKFVTISIDSLRRHINVTAHEGELKLALKELLVNAIKFNRPEGHVSVVIKCDLEWAAVRIADTGGGMPKSYRPWAASPFVQGDGSLSRPEGGVGLGLALADTIAKANNGVLKIDSESGRGVTAIFALRRAPIDAAIAGAA